MLDLIRPGKIKVIAVFTLLIFLLINVTTVCAAADIKLAPESVKPGEDVMVSGVFNSDTWLTIKVLNDTGSIVFFGIVKSDKAGDFSCNFRAPDLTPGRLTVIAGYNSTVSQATLTLKSNMQEPDDPQDPKDSEETEDSENLNEPQQPQNSEEQKVPENQQGPPNSKDPKEPVEPSPALSPTADSSLPSIIIGLLLIGIISALAILRKKRNNKTETR